MFSKLSPFKEIAIGSWKSDATKRGSDKHRAQPRVH